MKTDRIRATVKILKTSRASGPIRLLAPGPGVVVSDDPDFARDNALETILDLFLPAGRTQALTLAAEPGAIRRIILGGRDLPFTPTPEGICVELPALTEDCVHSGETHTMIVERGVELRVEHADIRRRAGDYATGTFPIRQHRAALALEFALREAVWTMGLDQMAEQAGLGPILIMGFDTNNPHGHRDSPPHVHMHMYLPRSGAPIGHYYLSEDCLFDHAIVGFRNDPRPDLHIPPGTAFTTTGNDDTPVFTATITKTGGLRIAAPTGAQCTIFPHGPGFDSGAVLCRPDGSEIVIKAAADFPSGLLSVQIGDRLERHRYDPDTGWLIGSESGIASPAGEIAEWN